MAEIPDIFSMPRRGPGRPPRKFDDATTPSRATIKTEFFNYAPSTSKSTCLPRDSRTTARGYGVGASGRGDLVEQSSGETHKNYFLTFVVHAHKYRLSVAAMDADASTESPTSAQKFDNGGEDEGAENDANATKNHSPVAKNGRRFSTRVHSRQNGAKVFGAKFEIF